ncbi:hypothetical protein [Muricoccus aerilatus]|uniref:hypothetical protein n=1 Tax=Muricoccus aerilatus TaxID=452982 RepID=UPI0005C21CBC|nr:hypothetical protein [Roseomonas aerilata]
MRFLTLAAAMVLAATPAFANLYDGRSSTGRSPGAPLDRGPYSSRADGAYAGGGLVLEGAPGAPAPMPYQTAPAGSLMPDRGFRDRAASGMPDSGMPERMDDRTASSAPYGAYGGMPSRPMAPMYAPSPYSGGMSSDMSRQGMMQERMPQPMPMAQPIPMR